MAQGYDRGDLTHSYAHKTTDDEGSGRTLGDTPTKGRGHAAVMRSWGVQGKYPWLDYYATLQDQKNWGIIKPAQTKMLFRNYDAQGDYLVASNVYTPYLYGMPWQPNPPVRTKQVSRFGGEQPNQLGMQQLQAMQYQMRAYPALMTQARNYFFGTGG